MENKRLEEIVELLWHTPGGWAELAAEDIKDLFAENERLRAELATKAGYDTWMRTAKALGRELDEATESEKRYHEAAQEWEHLCRASEARLATARVAIKSYHCELVDTREHVKTLTTENERLRAGRQQFIQATMTEAARAAESRLATAVGLPRYQIGGEVYVVASALDAALASAQPAQPKEGES